MATDQELEEIRRRIDIVDLISHYVTLKKAGANFKALCPFHEERTGSFMVSSEKQIFKCFGCNEGGDIFGFIMKLEGLNFPEAVKFLADRAGVALTEHSYDPKEAKDDKNKLLAINELSTKYFHMILTEHPTGVKAKEYLHKRNITDESIKKFRLGYAPSKRLLAEFLSKKGYSANEISAAGRPDRFLNRIMFPICDPMGNVIAFTGREFPEGSGPKYLNTSDTSLFHKSRAVYGLNQAKIAIRQKQSVIFVEGQVDVISSHQVGIENTVASSGTALTGDHLKIMYRYAQYFILAFDNDEAGKKATEKVIDMSLTENYITDVIVFPQEYKDAGEIIEKNPSLWPQIVKKAIPAVQWHINKAFLAFNAEPTHAGVKYLDGTQKKLIAGRLLSIINKISDEIEKTHYLDKLHSLGISRETLFQSMNKTGQHAERKTPDILIAKEKLDLESQIIANFLFYPKIAHEFVQELKENYFPDQYHPIVKEIKIWYNDIKLNRDKVEIVSYLQSRLDKSANLLIDKIINSSLHPGNELELKEEQTEAIASEIKEALEHFRSTIYEKKKIDFANLIAEAESAGDRRKVKDLLEELQTFIQNSGGIKNG